MSQNLLSKVRSCLHILVKTNCVLHVFIIHLNLMNKICSQLFKSLVIEVVRQEFVKSSKKNKTMSALFFSFFAEKKSSEFLT